MSKNFLTSLLLLITISIVISFKTNFRGSFFGQFKTSSNLATNIQKHTVINLVNNMDIPIHKSEVLSDEDEGEDEESAEPTVEEVNLDESPGSELSVFEKGIAFPTSVNGSDVRVGIIMARWNADIIAGLYKGVNESLTNCGVKASNVFTTYVPGSFELPITARYFAVIIFALCFNFYFDIILFSLFYGKII